MLLELERLASLPALPATRAIIIRGIAKLGSSLDAFKAGKAAMIVEYAYRAPEIDAASPELKYKMASLPQVDAASPVNQAEFWVEQVSKDSKQSEVAWDFLEVRIYSHTVESLQHCYVPPRGTQRS
jgi:maltose-binding protein MalE